MKNGKKYMSAWASGFVNVFMMMVIALIPVALVLTASIGYIHQSVGAEAAFPESSVISSKDGVLEALLSLQNVKPICQAN